MKRNFIIACLALMAGMAWAAEPVNVTPDQARNELNGGKVYTISISEEEGYGDIVNDTLTVKGFEKFMSGMKIKRDKLGRVVKMDLEENESYEDGTTISSSLNAKYIYKDNTCRKHIETGVSSNINDNIIEGMSWLCHYQYADNSNTPISCLSIETNVYGQPQSVSYQTYTHPAFDKYGNWTKRKITDWSCDLSIEEEEGGTVRKQLMNLSIALMNEKLSDSKRAETEKKLIAILKKQVEPDKATHVRKFKYFK